MKKFNHDQVDLSSSIYRLSQSHSITTYPNIPNQNARIRLLCSLRAYRHYFKLRAGRRAQRLSPACQSGRPMGPVRRCLLDVPSKLDKAVGPKLDAKSKIHFVPSLPTPAATSCFDVEREAASAQLSQTFGK